MTANLLTLNSTNGALHMTKMITARSSVMLTIIMLLMPSNSVLWHLLIYSLTYLLRNTKWKPFLDTGSRKMKMSENSRSEDELGQKWDRCITDTSIKFGIGICSFSWAVGLPVNDGDPPSLLSPWVKEQTCLMPAVYCGCADIPKSEMVI